MSAGRHVKPNRESAGLDVDKIKVLRKKFGPSQKKFGKLMGDVLSKYRISLLERKKFEIAKIDDNDINEIVNKLNEVRPELNLTYDFFDHSIDIVKFKELISKKKIIPPITTHDIDYDIIGNHISIDDLLDSPNDIKSSIINMISVKDEELKFFKEAVESLKKLGKYDDIIWIRTPKNNLSKKVVLRKEEVLRTIIESLNQEQSENIPADNEQRKFAYDLLTKKRILLIFVGLKTIYNKEENTIKELVLTIPHPSKAIIIDTQQEFVSYILHQFHIGLVKYASQLNPYNKQKFADKNKELLRWAIDDLRKGAKQVKSENMYFPK